LGFRSFSTLLLRSGCHDDEGTLDAADKEERNFLLAE